MEKIEKKQILIQVRDKIATLVSESCIVCGNDDYEVVFDFDNDWSHQEVKTAVFVYAGVPVEKLFDGNICEGIAVEGAIICEIGVYAGDIKTTTSATISCIPSIRDIARTAHKSPTEDVYNQIMELLNKYISEGAKPDPAEIQRMVEEYLAEHPAQDGISPTVSVVETTVGNRVTITDLNGSKSFDVKNGTKGDKGDKGDSGTSVTHSWQGTTLIVTSASGTSSADLKGDKGDTGAKGSKGDKGDKGERGERGERGIQGIKGEQGERGLQGEKGEKGDIGARIVKTELFGVDSEGNNIYQQTFADGTTAKFVAPKGERGEQGQQGERGLRGEQGEQGAKGENGFSPIIKSTPITDGHRISITDAQGTNSFELFNGEKGERGEQGEQGRQGEQGIQGIQGEKGDKGDTGANGADGNDGYTPVRGTDYWTEADKADIKSYVDEAILGGEW